MNNNNNNMNFNSKNFQNMNYNDNMNNNSKNYNNNYNNYNNMNNMNNNLSGNNNSNLNNNMNAVNNNNMNYNMNHSKNNYNNNDNFNNMNNNNYNNGNYINMNNGYNNGNYNNLNNNGNFNNMNNNNSNINQQQMSNQNSNNVNNNNNNNNVPQNLGFPRNINVYLSNLGDTSYLNAVLYFLGNFHFLVRYFLETERPEFFSNDIKNRPLSFVIYRLFLHFYPKELKAQEIYEPKAILQLLGHLNIVYKSQHWRNPNELISFMLNTLHNELNILKNNNVNNTNNYNIYNKDNVINNGIAKFGKTNNSIISNALNWFEIKESFCIQCKKNMYNFNTFNIFELDILGCSQMKKNKKITIYDCLDYQKSIKNKKLYCHSCKNYTQMNNRSNIYCAPNIFIFSLDRGHFDQPLLDIKVSFDEDLNLSPYIEMDKSPKNYKLIGIISLKKRPKSSDYDYCNFCKSFYDNQWYFYNDNEIRNSMKLTAIINANINYYSPCLLAYKSI